MSKSPRFCAKIFGQKLLLQNFQTFLKKSSKISCKKRVERTGCGEKLLPTAIKNQ